MKRFWDKVHKTPTCWEWVGAITSRGYGAIGYKKKIMQAHRLSLIFVGRDPGELHVLHKCDNKKCVNPQHLFVGTHNDNMRDMAAKGRSISPNLFKTHCPKGHAYTEENTYRDNQGWRKCRTCVLARLRRYYASPVEPPDPRP